ncbi:unnamed protein product, partial [Mesorhabditis spiculigera]
MALVKLDSPHIVEPGTSTWGAIAGELKSRQKVAKVRPTPQVRLNPPRYPGGAMPTMDDGCLKTEYHQPTDFLSPPHLSARNSSASSLLLGKDEDALSVAGTVFNEPWDSSAWDNLLDLAHHGDSRTTRMNEPIAEEDDSDSDRSSPMLDSEPELSYSPSFHPTPRHIPSDHVTQKSWDTSHYGNFSTINSRISERANTLGRDGRMASHDTSMNSLPRSASRFSTMGTESVGDLDSATFSPLISRSPKKRHPSDDTGACAIQKYVEKLADSKKTVFGAKVRKFIECTVESEESDPGVVFRNIRQFTSGIKNYLVKHGEEELHEKISSETSRLKGNQILNIDAILDSVLHKILLKPINHYLYHLMVKALNANGSLAAFSANFTLIKSLSLKQLGFRRPDLISEPSPKTMALIKMHLKKMQSHYSPLKKLENLLRVVSLVTDDEENTVPLGSTLKRNQSLSFPSADDLVRWFVYLLPRFECFECELQAWYMWELLPPQTQADAAYYLGILLSAIMIIKSADEIRRLGDDSHFRSTMDITRAGSPASYAHLSSDAFISVVIPDELNGCIRYSTLPGVRQMTVDKLCKIVANQQGITNPEDYGLYVLRDGLEECLGAKESPAAIRDGARARHCPHLFVYKRHNAKIAWPQQLPISRSPAIGSHPLPQLSA